MPSKLKTSATLLNVYGWIFIVLGALFALFFFGFGFLGLYSQDSSTAVGSIVIGGFIGFVILVVMVGMGVFHVIVARALRNQKSWARVAAIILGILMLGSFPLGTIFGIFILVGIFDKESEQWIEASTKPAA